MIDSSGSPYRDRKDAGRVLARKVSVYSGERPVVLGLPRGGVIVAGEIADGLGWDMDIIVTGKLRSPFNPELAFGAVDEEGRVYLDTKIVDELGISEEYIKKEKDSRLREVRSRIERFRRIKERIPLEGRVCVLVDDGIATGATMFSAIDAVHASNPDRIIVAIPGGPIDTIRKIERNDKVCEVICPVVPPLFYAVSQLYVDFGEVSDEEVAEVLRRFRTLKRTSM